MIIHVTHWPKSSFVTCGANDFCQRRPDTWFCQYTCGRIKPNYPVPAIRYADELVHWNDAIHFTVMYRKNRTHWAVVGDYPGKPLIF